MTKLLLVFATASAVGGLFAIGKRAAEGPRESVTRIEDIWDIPDCGEGMQTIVVTENGGTYVLCAKPQTKVVTFEEYRGNRL